MAFRASVVIPRPIEQAFDFAVYQIGSGRWQYRVNVDQLAGEENAEGSTYERRSIVGQSHEVTNTRRDQRPLTNAHRANVSPTATLDAGEAGPIEAAQHGGERT